MARSPTAPPSNHAYGAAVDINAPENPYGAAPTMDPRIVRIFEAHGFLWGGDFLIPDGMHFEYGSGWNGPAPEGRWRDRCARATWDQRPRARTPASRYPLK